METLKKNFAELVKLKTIVTMSMTFVFCYLAVQGKIPETFMTVYTMIIGFYFGTQSRKDQTAEKSGTTCPAVPLCYTGAAARRINDHLSHDITALLR